MNYERVTWMPFIGVLGFILGVMLYALAAILGLLRATFLNGLIDKQIVESLLWYSPLPIVIGLGFFILGLGKVIRKRAARTLVHEEIGCEKITVALTAYNDELSIAAAVKDFKGHDLVGNVVVISNNSTDETFKRAKEAGAIVFNEEQQGYGACVRRAMEEACKIDESGIIAISEGDCTFRAYDLEKMLPYLAHSNVVNGTRIVEALQERSTQLSVFMHYGNLFVGKLLEAKYLGDVSLTDVGTTYKVMRADSLRALLPKLDQEVNLTFNPYFLETAISESYKLVEVPITFHPRVGLSKGGNVSDMIALKLGLKMIVGIIIGWKYAK